MSLPIIDGTGRGYLAKIDPNNQIHTHTISRSSTDDAIAKGNAYNINTGWISLTSSTPSAVFYFKNDEPPVNGESSIYIESIVIGTDGLGTTTSGAPVETVIYRNPTGGTIIDNAVAVSYNSNRNFGSNNALGSTTFAYKGVEGDTLTGGIGVALLAAGINTRIQYQLGFYLPKGASIGLTVDTQTTAGTTRCYVALICHRVDGKNN